MRIAFSADWHINAFKEFSRDISVVWDKTSLRFMEVTPDENNHEIKIMNSRVYNTLNGICDIRDYCAKNNISHLLFGGDLFHRRKTIDVDTFNYTWTVLNSFSAMLIQVHAIAGNHDDTSNEVIPQTALHSFQDTIHVIEKPTYFMIGGQEIVAIPYSKDKKFVLDSIMKLKRMCADTRSVILMCHLGINHGLVGSGAYMMSDEYDLRELSYDKWKYVLCGHYHLGQFLAHNTVYSGTPVQQNFGDERPDGNYNGFFVIDTSRRWDIRFIQLVAPRFVTVKSTEELESLSPDFIKSNYIRVVSQADRAGDIQEKLTEILGDDTSSVKLELEKSYNTEQRSAVSVTQSPEEVVKTYASERWEDKERLEAVTTVGLEIMQEALTT